MIRRQRIICRRIFQQENPIVAATARRRRVRLNSPLIGLVNQVGNSVARIVPNLLHSRTLNHTFVERKRPKCGGVNVKNLKTLFSIAAGGEVCVNVVAIC